MSVSSTWRSWLAGAASIFDAVISSHSPLKRALRIWLRKRLRRMMKVQARMLVPAWKRFRAAQALSNVSWTRSSARSRLPDSERPNARRWGMTWASWSLNSSSGSGTGSGRASGASSPSSSSITGCRFTLPPSGYAALNSLMLAGSVNRPPLPFEIGSYRQISNNRRKMTITRPRLTGRMTRTMWFDWPARARVASIWRSPSCMVPRLGNSFQAGNARWAGRFRERHLSDSHFSLPPRRFAPTCGKVTVTKRKRSGRDGGVVEKQRLGDRRLHRRALERLGDEEGRLGPLARQKPLGESGDEDDRHLELAEYVLDRVDAGAVVGELDVGEDEPRPARHRLRDRFVAGDGDSGHRVAE